MEHYSAIKENEGEPFATTCVDLETVMLSEARQRKKYSMIPFKPGI